MELSWPKMVGPPTEHNNVHMCKKTVTSNGGNARSSPHGRRTTVEKRRFLCCWYLNGSTHLVCLSSSSCCCVNVNTTGCFSIMSTQTLWAFCFYESAHLFFQLPTRNKTCNVFVHNLRRSICRLCCSLQQKDLRDLLTFSVILGVFRK